MGTDNRRVWFIVIGLLAVAFLIWAIVGMNKTPISDGYATPPATQGDAP